MKHILTAAAALLLISSAAFAQKNRVRDVDYFPRSEIYLQYGTPSLMELTTILSPNFHDEVTNGETRNHKFSGIAAIGYNFFIHPRVSIGLDFGYGYGSSDMYISDVDEFGPAGDPQYMCKAVVMNYSCHLSGAFTYWQQGPMECSGALYLGVNYMDESVRDAVSDELEPNDHLNFSFHITAVKFRYGDMVGGFAELGFGYRGLVNVGLSIKI
ncbi:MAG TPA: hypothetical protein IAB85_02535 [Candidatus Coprenecus merdigallinarum]|nr:hypothetical protein [Candidatus Coprenecus merdigallinarum]